MPHHVVLSVLFFREGDAWVAQSLERDIAAHGSSFEEARTAFERTLSGYFKLAITHHQEPLASLGPAPEAFWAAWRRAEKQLMEPIGSGDPAVPPAYVIRAITDETVSAM